MNVLYWKQESRFIAGTTLRNPLLPENNNMALHTGGDLQAVIQNRQTLCDSLQIPLSAVTFAQQTHSDHLQEVRAEDIGKGSIHYSEAIPDCDALYTKQKDVMIGVFHADCVPILLHDPIKEIIVAIHSGWQGTTKEITKKAMAYLIEHEHIDPRDVQAYIGPAINYDSLEVGLEVVEQVKAMSIETSPYITYLGNDKALIDNKGLNKQMLLDMGVRADHVLMNQSDTFTQNESLFSYRRDHACGRHLSFIMMRSCS